jgi:hypothetical protein
MLSQFEKITLSVHDHLSPVVWQGTSCKQLKQLVIITIPNFIPLQNQLLEIVSLVAQT